jgi:aspartyl-tRNA(Asn)/glutamyl-tRNA(Gln) amidotransferase subunit B
VLSSTAAKKVAEELFASPRDPEIIAKEKGLVQISDDGVLARIAADIIAQNPQSVHDYKAGKEKALGFLMGQAMRASRGQGNPQIFNRLIKEQLDEI